MAISTVPRGSLLVLLILPLAAMAQTVPNSGKLLQQLQPQRPTKPIRKPKLHVEKPAEHHAQSRTPFEVDHIVIEGATVFHPATLHALLASAEGHKLTLAKLQALAARISHYYHAHGYPLARTIVPPQTLDNGSVRLRVIEARFDRVNVTNTSRVSTALIHATVAPIHPGKVVTQASLDRSLLLLGDLPGVTAHAVLRPGREIGTTQMDVDAAATPFMTGDIYLDNAGTRYSGRVRAGANINLNSPLHHGDRLSVGALTSGSGLSYARVAYQWTLNGAGTRIGAGYSGLHYRLAGDTVSALDAHGTARVASVWLAQPLIRSRYSSIDARLQFNRKQLADDIGATGMRNHRRLNSWILNLFGQHRDDWLGGGLTRAGIGITYGKLHFNNAAAAAADAATARTQGSYTHWNAYLSRLQYLMTNWRLYVGLRGQGSSDNLDSSEQFLLGGSANVRGYEAGSLAGSNGWLASIALRHDLDWGCAGRCQGRVFVDSGAIRTNARPWAPGHNHARLSSAGVGFYWTGTRQWQAQAQLALPVGARPHDPEHHGALLSVRVIKGF